MVWSSLIVAVVGGTVAASISALCALLIAKRNNSHQLEQNRIAREWQEKQDFEKWVREEKLQSYNALLKCCHQLVTEFTRLQSLKDRYDDVAKLNGLLDELLDFKIFLLANDEVLEANKNIIGVMMHIRNVIGHNRDSKLAVMSTAQQEATRKLEIAMRKDLGIPDSEFHKQEPTSIPLVDI